MATDKFNQLKEILEVHKYLSLILKVHGPKHLAGFILCQSLLRFFLALSQLKPQAQPCTTCTSLVKGPPKITEGDPLEPYWPIFRIPYLLE